LTSAASTPFLAPVRRPPYHADVLSQILGHVISLIRVMRVDYLCSLHLLHQLRLSPQQTLLQQSKEGASTSTSLIVAKTAVDHCSFQADIPNGLPQLLHPLTSEFPATRIKRAPLVLIRAPRSLPPGGTTPCGCFLTIPFGGWQILISAETSCSLSGYTPAKIQKCGTARPFHIRTKISRWRLQVPQTAPVCDVRSRHCDG
jgi:hypothetical protein